MRWVLFICEIMEKIDYIRAISSLSNRRGDKLVDMMDKYNRRCLDDVTYDEVKEYYEELLEQKEKIYDYYKMVQK